MTAAIAQIGALLLSVVLLLMGNGLHSTLVPMRAQIEHFSPTSIGLIGSAYFAGFVLGCLWCPSIVRRVGHIRSFAALAALTSAVVLVHPLLLHPGTWIGLRLLTGFCFAGLYAVIESWLNEQATNENRGQVLSIYQIVNFGALICGQFLLNAADPAGLSIFSFVAILVALSVLPVTVGATHSPLPIARVRISLRWLYDMSPVGVLGCLTVGLANGAFWALAPAFAQQSGLNISETASFMAVTILGGLVFQWPLGRLSDRMDRRHVIAGVCIASALAAAGVVVAAMLQHANSMLLLAFIFGGFTFPLYSLCVAHANDFAPSDSFFEVSGGLLLTYGIGAVFGPAIASLLITAIAPPALYGFIGAVYVAVAGLIVGCIRQHPRLPVEEMVRFRGVPRTTPEVFNLDPRNPIEKSETTEVDPPKPL